MENNNGSNGKLSKRKAEKIVNELNESAKTTLINVVVDVLPKNQIPKILSSMLDKLNDDVALNELSKAIEAKKELLKKKKDKVSIVLKHMENLGVELSDLQ